MPDPLTLITLACLAGLTLLTGVAFLAVCWRLETQRLRTEVRLALLEAAYVEWADETGQGTMLPHLRGGRTP